MAALTKTFMVVVKTDDDWEGGEDELVRVICTDEEWQLGTKHYVFDLDAPPIPIELKMTPGVMNLGPVAEEDVPE